MAGAVPDRGGLALLRADRPRARPRPGDLASYRTGILAAAAVAAGLTVLCVLIFVLALQLRLPLFGPWLPFSS